MSSWSTHHEIDFINEMVSVYYTRGGKQGMTLEKLINNYIKCALHRRENGLTPEVNWGKCIKEAQMILDSLS